MADLSRRLAAALADHDSGRVAPAEAAYRDILRAHPDEPDALNLLATLLQEQGELDQAIALLTRALAVDPAFPEALCNLSRARRLSGDLAAAAELARRAIGFDPKMAEAHLNLGRALIDLDNDAGAVIALRQAAVLAPGVLGVLAPLGNALLRLHDNAAAAEVLTEALTLDPTRVDLMINLAAALNAIDRNDEALAWLNQAATAEPDNPEAQAGIAVVSMRMQEVNGAIAACRRTIELAPARIEIWLLLSAALRATGKFAEAEACCRQALTLDPDSAAARRELATFGRFEADAAEVSRLRAILDDTAAPRRDRIAAGMTVGTLLDRRGDYDTAFAAFAGANRLIRAHWLERGEIPGNAALRRDTDRAATIFTPEHFAATADLGDPSELPVFIVGMPRSGTTLVEQIAASHPLVFGAGERRDIAGIVHSLNTAAGDASPAAWDRESTRRAASAQIERLRGLAIEAGRGSAVRVTDKMPDNSRLLGHIATLFPRARVIVCRRDLRDVCLSCHFQQFADGGMLWTTDQTELAERAHQIDRGLAHFLAVLPLPVLEVHYENLVHDLEAESRRLIDFLGLPWDAACLAFHQTERPVLTASVWQVRQPLYSGSVGRWRRYRRHLGPLLDGLQGLVPADDGRG